MIESKTKLIQIVAHAGTQEVTAWPTDAKGIREGDEVVWQLYLDLSDGGTFPPDPGKVRKLEVPFVLKLNPADGFDRVEVHGVGCGAARAEKQGVYHYEVAFTIEDRVFAIFGCPSAEVRK